MKKEGQDGELELRLFPLSFLSTSLFVILLILV